MCLTDTIMLNFSVYKRDNGRFNKNYFCKNAYQRSCLYIYLFLQRACLKYNERNNLKAIGKTRSKKRMQGVAIDH